jgi:hypothetical protein
MTGVNEAAKASAELGKQALDWYRQIYADQAPERAAAADRAGKVADAQVDAMTTATTQAKDLDTYNKTVFRPLEQKIVADAQAYDTPARRMQAAAEAAADVDQSAAATRQANEMALARTGIAPGSARAMQVAEDSAGATVKARAGAMTTAVRNIEQQGYARQMDAAALGKGIASNQATQQQIATGAGSAGVQSGAAALAATQSGNTTMQQGFNAALDGQKAAGNLYGQVAQIEQSGQNAMMGLLGSAAGAAGFAFGRSDKNIKKGTGRMADTAKALAEIEATPVEEGWQYDPSKGGPDDGGQQHIGPMAQQVRKVSGEQAAPGGKVINLMDRMGRMEAAIQELSKQVRKDVKQDKKEAA